MADYPSSIKNFITLYDGTNKVIAAHPNDRGDEVTALQTLIGAFGTGQGNLVSLKTLLINYIDNCQADYKSAADLYIRAGEIAITDASENIRWRRITSDLTVNWDNLDTGVEAASTTYYVYACADAAGTTFTIKISTNSATPSGMTFYRKIGSFYNNSGSDIDRESVVCLPTEERPLLGDWETKSVDTTYQALSSGFVVAYRGPNGNIIVYTDAATPPTVKRGWHSDAGGDADDSAGTCTIPVKKGDYWKVTGASNVFWIPVKF